MEPQINQETALPEDIQPQKSHVGFYVALAVIVTAIIVGGVMYAWQRSVTAKMQIELQKHMQEAQQQKTTTSTKPMPIDSITSPSSIITSINEKDCVIKNGPYSSASGDCPGIGGYKIMTLDDDSRMSINVVSPDGTKHELNYWSVITGGFSSLGDTAEWRVGKSTSIITPTALIVQVNASENPDDPNQKTIYFAVAKITPAQICVTDKIPNGSNSHAQALLAADRAESKDCLNEIIY